MFQLESKKKSQQVIKNELKFFEILCISVTSEKGTQLYEIFVSHLTIPRKSKKSCDKRTQWLE